MVKIRIVLYKKFYQPIDRSGFIDLSTAGMIWFFMGLILFSCSSAERFTSLYDTERDLSPVHPQLVISRDSPVDRNPAEMPLSPDGALLTTEIGYLYIIRPCNPVLSLYGWSYEVAFFEGHFSEGRSQSLYKGKLRSCQYTVVAVPEGFSSVHMLSFGEHSGISRIVRQENQYVVLNMAAAGLFRIPEIFPSETNRAAARHYLDGMRRVYAEPILISNADS